MTKKTVQQQIDEFLNNLLVPTMKEMERIADINDPEKMEREKTNFMNEFSEAEEAFADLYGEHSTRELVTFKLMKKHPFLLRSVMKSYIEIDPLPAKRDVDFFRAVSSIASLIEMFLYVANEGSPPKIEIPEGFESAIENAAQKSDEKDKE